MKFSIRSVLVAALVGLQLAAVTTIIISSYLTSQQALLGHARDLMMDVATETIDHSVNFLQPAQEAADLSQRLAQQDVVNSENSIGLERYFFEHLRSHRQFAGIFYGNEAGEFIYIKRDTSREGAHYRTKIISAPGGQRQVELIWRGADFTQVTQERDPTDSYDPRKRPWYERAAERRGVAWTDPYIFFTSQNPGVTVAAPVLAGASGVKGVVGVDIEIGEISEFIGGLEIGESGAAFILNGNGNVLAHPDPSKIKTLKSDSAAELRFTRIDELDDPVSRAAFGSLGVAAEGFQVPAPTFTSFEFENEPYLAIFAPMPQSRWPWTVGIYVPENDFLGTIKKNRQQNIFIALIIAAVTGMIGLVIARTITRPIAALYRRADAVSRGEFPVAEPVPSKYEELTRAGTAFNRMATWLDSYKVDNEKLTRDLRAASRDLEVRVEERTGALSEANKQLRDEIEERKNAQIQLSHEVERHMKTGEALRETRDRANAANRAKSRFLSNMSHELRTPLNVILGFGQMLKLKEHRHPSERADRYVDHILESGNSLLGLIDQVLDLAKIEAGRMPVSIQPVRTAQIVSVALLQAKVLAAEKNLEIVDSTDPALLLDVAADPDHLKQALMNLISNAIKYNRDGGKVTLRSERHGSNLRLAVEDTGIGIADNLQHQLFEPFNRLGAENSGIEGTGVGLALTKQITEMMGGRIGFHSTEGKGSSFWIDLPFAPVSGVAGVSSGSDDAVAARIAFHRQMRVLYVDDHDLSRLIVAEAFGDRSDLTIETACSAEEGLDKAKGTNPDLVILDINMPGMDGFALLQELRSDASCEKTPVIALTANAMPHQVKRGIDAGFAHYLTKPINLWELQSVVVQTLATA